MMPERMITIQAAGQARLDKATAMDIGIEPEDVKLSAAVTFAWALA